MINFVIDEKGEEVISERHQKNYKKETEEPTQAAAPVAKAEETDTSSFTDIEFDDI